MREIGLAGIAVFIVLVLVGTALYVSVSTADEKPPSLEPTALEMFLPDRLLTQTSVDAQVPDWSDFHTAWLVEWEGSRPARLTIERFVRGECFARATYLHLGQGELLQQSFEMKAVRGEGEEATPADVIISRVVREIGSGEEDWLHRWDVAGRLIYAFRKIEFGSSTATDVEEILRVNYQPEACTLKRVLRTREVPAKETPAGRAGRPRNTDP